MTGRPASITAAAELDVPKSIPITLAMLIPPQFFQNIFIEGKIDSKAADAAKNLIFPKHFYRGKN
jgi:hypothetical protein